MSKTEQTTAPVILSDVDETTEGVQPDRSNAMTIIHDLADQTIDYCNREGEAGASAQQILAYTLFKSHVLGMVPEGVNLANAYLLQGDDRTARNNLLLHHVFGVVELNAKGNYSVCAGYDKATVSSLKTKLNRAFAVVAWFIKCHDETAETLASITDKIDVKHVIVDGFDYADNIVMLNDKGQLCTKGWIAYKSGEIANNAMKVLNAVTVGKGGDLSYNWLMQRADTGLGFEREQRGARANVELTPGEQVKSSNVNKAVHALDTYIVGLEADTLTKKTREALHDLWEHIADVLEPEKTETTDKKTAKVS